MIGTWYRCFDILISAVDVDQQKHNMSIKIYIAMKGSEELLPDKT